VTALQSFGILIDLGFTEVCLIAFAFDGCRERSTRSTFGRDPAAARRGAPKVGESNASLRHRCNESDPLSVPFSDGLR
jgi:hypothetical protein